MLILLELFYIDTSGPLVDDSCEEFKAVDVEVVEIKRHDATYRLVSANAYQKQSLAAVIADNYLVHTITQATTHYAAVVSR